MDDEAQRRRAEMTERANYHVAAQRNLEAQESVKAQVLIDAFVARFRELGVPTEELTAAPWSGRGRYRTGIQGWYLRHDRALGVGADGGYYLLVTPTTWFGRFRRVTIPRTPPPLQVGRGARDGESIALDVLLQTRFEWDDVPQQQ